ncbi:hypothetical protein [Tautonia rosea]|uniref:hypothetical protein n=1 Tax=Tautonia rosea TaxID=2728037 RepID=UPI0019D2595D|nr:hypothetical protein [Tautonia rosea]
MDIAVLEQSAADRLAGATLPQLVELFRDADVPTTPATKNDVSRSTAERFLFNRLEPLPKTAGGFWLDHPLQFPRGR